MEEQQQQQPLLLFLLLASLAPLDSARFWTRI
jgi:hypothetical protein